MAIQMEKIQKQAEELLDRFEIPSVSITCYQDGKFQTVTAGWKDAEAKIPADEATMYSIGSATKSFTAASIGILCDRGLLDLEDPVKKYIPEFAMFDPYVTEHLTIRDTLCHRCGLSRHELAWYSRLEDYDDQDILYMLRNLKPNVPFRYKMQYQNIMFALAGMVISRISGMEWEDFVQKNIVEPLGMGPISYDAPEFRTFKEAATGYLYSNNPVPGNHPVPYSTLNRMCSAGSLSMTSRQLAAWDAMFLNKGKAPDGTQVLSEKMCEEMLSPQMLISDPIIEPLKGVQDMTSYGLGLFLESYRGVKVAHHGGHIDGFIADQCIVPSKNFACTVLTNSENHVGARVIRYLILDALLESETTDWMGKFLNYQKAQAEASENALTSAEKIAEASAAYPCPAKPEDLEGTYLDAGYGDIKIRSTSDDPAKIRLSVMLGTLGLTAVHYRSQYFLFREDRILTGVEIPGNVEIDINGNVIGFSIDLNMDGNKIFFKKQK